MCIKIAPSRIQLESMNNKETTVTLKPARRTRTKIRKPKFLSLRLELSPENTSPSGGMPATTSTHQLNLFPLHPGNLVEDKDTHEENMACFFSAADGAATTLTGLLKAETSSSDEENNLSPSSLSYAYRGEEGELVRTAMRNKERDVSEEKWVCYSEVVERKDEEVSSGAGADLRHGNQTEGLLSLKLDYEEIMNAWSDKGPLYIHLDSPQTVPDLHDDDVISRSTGDRSGWESSNGGLWRVPEMKRVKKEAGGGGGGGGGGGAVEEWKKMGQREASVQRYKEKRQNRLFSKTIRYQVRKLNAEKRPRIKGRFVKRS